MQESCIRVPVSTLTTTLIRAKFAPLFPSLSLPPGVLDAGEAGTGILRGEAEVRDLGGELAVLPEFNRIGEGALLLSVGGRAARCADWFPAGRILSCAKGEGVKGSARAAW